MTKVTVIDGEGAHEGVLQADDTITPAGVVQRETAMALQVGDVIADGPAEGYVVLHPPTKYQTFMGMSVGVWFTRPGGSTKELMLRTDVPINVKEPA